MINARLAIAAAVVIAALGVIAWRYWDLQIERHQEFVTRAESNRIKIRPLVPARGLIFDRNGELLADNIPAYRLQATPEEAGDRTPLLAALGEIIRIPPDEQARISREWQASKRFRPITLRLDLDEGEVARFAARRYRFPGVEVVPYLSRRYPHGPLTAHVVGYVSRIDARDIEQMDDPQAYAGTAIIGKGGIERSHEVALHGKVGFAQVEVNSEGRTLRELERQPPSAGEHLYLSLDVGLQRAATEAFAGQHGAAVAIDPRNGEVLALVSLPSYDTNLFIGGISSKNYRALADDPAQPLFNRAVQGGYEPGSTMKPFVGLAGLELGVRTPATRVLSTGAYRIRGRGRDYRDWRAGGHGSVDLNQALAQSVNTYFYSLAVDIGMDPLADFLEGFGFGEKTGIDLPSETAGVLPRPAWKTKNRGTPWVLGETVIAGIGQGYWVTSPVQLASATATLAARGGRHRPHLLHATGGGAADALREADRQALPPLTLDPTNLDAVIGGMVAVMHGPTGTARAAAAGAPYRIAGKTGTAQRVSRVGATARDPKSLPMHLRNRALFVAFAPAEEPRIAVAIVVEHGGSGSRAAAPVARRILDAWLLREPAP